LIYARNEVEPKGIKSLNIVMKGQWRMSNDEVKEDFIYKKVAEIENEELLE
jgi:hypothetical protein